MLPPFPAAAQAYGSDLLSVCEMYDKAGCGAGLDDLSAFLGLDFRRLPSMCSIPGTAGKPTLGTVLLPPPYAHLLSLFLTLPLHSAKILTHMSW